MNSETDWNQPHSHDPNPTPPTADATLTLFIKDEAIALTPEALRTLPQRVVHDCYIVSTGHGTSGPFEFVGVPLAEIVAAYANYPIVAVDVTSADGYRTRLRLEDFDRASDSPIILALSIGGRPLSRLEGLVRLIVPQERDDALKQVKWVREIRLIEK